MSWLYQPLPLASTFTVSDVTVALDATATSVATAHGTLVQSASALLAGSEVASGHGLMDLGDTSETIAGTEVAVETGTLIRTNVVRLRSRKVGGASTADRLLDGIQAQTQAGTTTKVVSVLLGGTGITTAQQSFPTKTVARLLVGQERVVEKGTVTGSSSSGFIPNWVQIPTQLDEENMYENVLFWTGTTTAKKSPGTTAVAPMATGGFPTTPTFTGATATFDVHNVTEADDLWNHYTMYKRTGEQRYLNWAQEWRDYYVDGSYQSDLSTCGPAGTWTHVYGGGLTMWAIERNDLDAKNKALELAVLMEAQTLSQVVPGVTNMSFNESRRYGRRTIFYNWISILEPIARWIDIRNTCLDAWVQSPGWHDTTHPVSPTLIGGNHYSARSQFASGSANLGETQFDQGYRVNHSFEYALHTEALWMGYKLTGRTDIRNMLIEMARHHLYYAWDPTHANPTVGGRWGHGPAGVRWHEFQDDFTAWTNTGETGLGPPDTINTNANLLPATNYEPSPVNCLVIGYKLTGETAFLTRAQEHWRQATCYASQSSGLTKLDQDTVHLYADTLRTETHFFNFNKGMLQYASQLMENGGVPETEVVWPPYAVPTTSGEVLTIGVNTPGDVLPSGITMSNWYYSLFDYYGGGVFVDEYSDGGAMAFAGTGGHTVPACNLGACVFDFQDATWKLHLANHGIAPRNTDFAISELASGGPSIAGTVIVSSPPLPAPAHNYNLQSQLRSTQGGGPQGSYLRLRGQAAGQTGGSGTSTWAFDFSTNQWTFASTNGVLSTGKDYRTVDYDTTTNRYYMVTSDIISNSALQYWDANDITWKQTSYSAPLSQGATKSMFIDDARHILVVQNTVSGGLRAIDLDGGTVWTTLTTSGTFPSNNETKWIFYPPDGCYYCYPGNNASNTGFIYKLTPPASISPPLSGTWTVSTVTLSTALPTVNPAVYSGSTSNAQHQNRFFYVPSLQLLCWMPGFPRTTGSSQVFLVKP